MRYPNLSEEKRLWKEGFEKVIGIDEAGRGPLAGPVMAAALVVSPNFKDRNLKCTVNDSKKIAEKKREYLYEKLLSNPHIEWGTGWVSAKVIDRINILEATKLAMKRAVINLNKKIKERNIIDGKSFLLIDGIIKLKLSLPQKPVIKGDAKIFSCAAASIIAKVRRDRMMERYCQRYPKYGFSSHKGYPTKHHIKMIKKHGSCLIHRKSFRHVV